MIECLAAITTGDVATAAGGLSLLGAASYLVRTIAKQRKAKLWGGFSVGGNGDEKEKAVAAMQGVCPAHEGLVMAVRGLGDTQKALLDGQNIIHEEMQKFGGKLDVLLTNQRHPPADLRGIPS